jgi:hypothetical protein
MQENKSAYSEEERQNNQNTAVGNLPSNNGNTAQQVRQVRPMEDMHSPLEPSEIDQQEGNMNNGTLGGNFGEDGVDKTFEHFSPPY